MKRLVPLLMWMAVGCGIPPEAPSRMVIEEEVVRLGGTVLEHGQIGYTIDLNQARIHDHELARLIETLKTVPELRALYLADTSASDAALAHIQYLPQLRMLMLSRERIGSPVIQQLQAANPRLQVAGPYTRPDGPMAPVTSPPAP